MGPRQQSTPMDADAYESRREKRDSGEIQEGTERLELRGSKKKPVFGGIIGSIRASLNSLGKEKQKPRKGPSPEQIKASEERLRQGFIEMQSIKESLSTNTVGAFIRNSQRIFDNLIQYGSDVSIAKNSSEVSAYLKMHFDVVMQLNQLIKQNEDVEKLEGLRPKLRDYLLTDLKNLIAEVNYIERDAMGVLIADISQSLRLYNFNDTSDTEQEMGPKKRPGKYGEM